jgi:hypothetical protein
MIGALRRIVQLFSGKRKRKDDDFNLLEALADHAPDIFRDELLAKHLDRTTASLLWQTSRKLKEAVEACESFSVVCSHCNPDSKLTFSFKHHCNCPMNCPVQHYVNHELFKTLELATWAKENGAKFDASFALRAVVWGTTEVLNWVISENCEMDEGCSEVAIEVNRKDKFLILRDAGCPVPKEICSYAAYEGNFDLLKWLHEDEGYDLHPLALERIYDEEVLDYYYEHATDGGLRAVDDDVAIYPFMRNAAARGNCAFAEWFIEKKLSEGITFTAWNGLIMAYALWEESPYRESFDEGFADWARAQGCPEPTDDDWKTLRLREKEPLYDDSESASESDTSSEAGPESDE